LLSNLLPFFIGWGTNEAWEKRMNVTLLNWTPDPELTIARAARLCYSKKFEENLTLDKARKLITNVVARGHESVLEHASFTFLIEGLSRAASHQLVRHRLVSFSQQSQRYIRFKNPNYVIPPSIESNPHATMIFNDIVERNIKIYQELLDMGIPEEDARYIFPQAITSHLILTANARELLHIFRLRLCNRAQWEIRILAEQMLNLVKEKAPIVFENAGPACLTGICPEGDKGCGQPWKRK
jgi:thymidylate synthase (FAD)